MNTNGLVIIVVGVWVITQVFAGDALRRLRLIGSVDPAAGPSPSPGGGGGSW